MNISFESAFKIIGALLFSVAGGGTIVVALGKRFADTLSQVMLEKYKNKHEKELEALKGEYSKELEVTKHELEKTRALFLRYSEKQFELYNNLWKILMFTKRIADSLWEHATLEKIPSFSQQIRLTKNAVNDNMLLIEKGHYKTLMEILDEFEKFSFGKFKLVDLITMNSQNISSKGITQEMTRSTISANKRIKNRYEKLIGEIEKSFRKQIKG